MKTNLTIICALLLILQSTMFGQKTEVKVNEGLVKVQTNAGEQYVHPGQIASLQAGENPNVKIDDPIVDDAIALFKIAKQERDKGETCYSLLSVQSYMLENNGQAHGALATEFTNHREYAMDLCLLGETTILDQGKAYSLDGVLLDYDIDIIAPNLGFYYLHYPCKVEPGDAFEFITTFELGIQLQSLNKGDHYEFTAGEGTPNNLAYYRLILPKGAEFLECTGNVDVLKIDSHYGRVGLTIKGHKSGNGSHYTVKFNLDDSLVEKPKKRAHDFRQLQNSQSAEKARLKKVLEESGGDWLEVYEFVIENDYRWPKGLHHVALKLVEAGHYEQALDLYRRVENNMSRIENPYSLESIIWQGHLLDMQGKRQQAIEKYQTALGVYPRYGRGCTRCDQWGILLNEDWVKERLEKPFTKEMLQPKF